MTTNFAVRLPFVTCAVAVALVLGIHRAEIAGGSTPTADAKVPVRAMPPVPVAWASSATSAAPLFGVRVSDDGGRQIYFGSAELQFEKTGYADGRTVVVLSAGSDRVEIATSPSAGILLRRGAEGLSMFPFDATEADYARARQMLAGSEAVRRFRALVAHLDGSNSRGVAALRLTDALVGFLDGDIGAPARLARRIAAARAASVRRVSDEGGNCWYDYEQNVDGAWEDYTQCATSFSIFNPLSAGCAATWAIRVEGYWAQYLSCSSLSSLIKDLEMD